jgi:hypothetical protein
MSTGAYILAHFADLEKLVPAAEKMATEKSIVRWDAVDGHVNLVVKTSDGETVKSSLKSLPGVDHLSAYPIQQDASTGSKLDPSLCHAYVFIEAEAKKRDALKKALDGIEDVLSASLTTGGCDLVLVVKGATFAAIERTIAERIRPLDGILRLKHNRIIDLKQL